MRHARKVRLERCRDLLDAQGLDALLVTAAADVRYLSGFRGDDATLVVGGDVAFICADSRYWDQVREEVEGFELVEVRGELLRESVEALRPVAARGRLGIQGAELSYAAYRAVRRHHAGGLRDVGGSVTQLRAVKDDGEVAVMRRAGQVTDAALTATVAGGLVGQREIDVAWRLREEYHRLGAEGEAFPAIVASGAHGAQAHAIPGERLIEAGELVVIDTGARLDGYCSDITRTYAAGEPSDDLRRIYDIVSAAQLEGLEAVRAGAHGRDDVDAASRGVIDAAGYGAQFGHGTGHGVGLEVHEAPSLGRTRGDRLEAGMVCTVEPGIYVDGVAGVRIEDTVLVTAEGCERLTTSPKELQVID